MKYSVPVNQLVLFHEDKMYKVDKDSKITYDSDKDAESVVSDSNLEFPSDTECCQRTENYVRSKAPLTSTPIKS